MTNVMRNTNLSCQYKMSSANKLVDRKVHFFFFCAIRNTRKKVPANLSSWGKPRKLDAAKINTFTVLCLKVFCALCRPHQGTGYLAFNSVF